jgi:alpha-acetolactate decarboxylase
MEDNSIYQFSLLNALMDGICEVGIPTSKLLQKGNQGLGTFVRMDGELVMLDGTVYQLKGDGSIRAADPHDEIPFAMSTLFRPTISIERAIPNKESIDEIFDEFFPHTANQFVSYRFEGAFKSMKVRTVRGQEYKGQPLSELGAKQSVFDYEDVEGTVVGFRSPESWQGFSVAGEHLHFISHDRKKGGHILELCSEGVKIGMALNSNVHVELPTDRDFNDAKLAMNDAEIRKVEG